jgi:nicotinamide riboside kinase
MREMPEKYAFVGTTSSGKTTVHDIYRHRFQGDSKVTVLEEGARIYFQTHPEITDRSAAIQKKLQDFVLEREKEAAKNPEVHMIISDRSVIDPIVVTRFYQDQKGAEELLKRIKIWLPNYTKFFVFDPDGIPFQSDPFRKETAAERLAMHDTFIEVLEEHELPYTIVRGTIDERVQAIDKTIFENVPKKKNLTAEKEVHLPLNP